MALFKLINNTLISDSKLINQCSITQETRSRLISQQGGLFPNKPQGNLTFGQNNQPMFGNNQNQGPGQGNFFSGNKGGLFANNQTQQQGNTNFFNSNQMGNNQMNTNRGIFANNQNQQQGMGLMGNNQQGNNMMFNRQNTMGSRFISATGTATKYIHESKHTNLL